jgi:hypothetical protein
MRNAEHLDLFSEKSTVSWLDTKIICETERNIGRAAVKEALKMVVLETHLDLLLAEREDYRALWAAIIWG